MKFRLLISILATAAMDCSTGAPPGSTTSMTSTAAADDLLGERFVSIAVEQDGQPLTRLEGPLELEFEDRGRDDVVRWNAGCNIFGGVFDITSDQLRPERTSDGHPEFGSTAVDCPEEQLEQDDWLADVFASSPAWTLADDGTLQVVGNGVRLTLEPAGH